MRELLLDIWTTVSAGLLSLREGKGYPFQDSWASPVAQMVKNLPAVQETWVRSLGQKDPLEEVMATHCSIFAWQIPWTEELGGL